MRPVEYSCDLLTGVILIGDIAGDAEERTASHGAVCCLQYHPSHVHFDKFCFLFH